MANEKCAHCGRDIVAGGKHQNNRLAPVYVNLINEYSEIKATEYCETCGSDIYAEVFPRYIAEYEELKASVMTAIEYIPVLTTTRPMNWEFEEVSIVTSRVTLGTGFLFSIGVGITDLFGDESSEYNSKIEKAEKMALTRLRIKAWELDCNAIIATDMDLENVGGQSALLLLSVSGTAVKLKNLSVLNNAAGQQLEKMQTAFGRLKYLHKLKPPETKLNAE